jgi:hypothetical protein
MRVLKMKIIYSSIKFLLRLLVVAIPLFWLAGISTFSNAAETVEVSTKLSITTSDGNTESESGLLAHWALDESNGSEALDSVGNHPGILVNTPTWRPTQGQFEGALEFDGSDDRVDLGILDVPGKEMSISFWLKADDFDEAEGRLISKATGTSSKDHYWMVSTFKNSSLRFRLKTNGTTTTLISSEDVISIGQWHHITVTYDGSKMSIYRDGELVASTRKMGNIDTNNKIPVAIGNQPANAGSRPFDGLIDEVRIYSTALAIDQIQMLIDSNITMDQADGTVKPSTKPTIPTTGGNTDPESELLSHWALDESNGSKAVDSLGNYPGTLVNAPTWQPTQGQLGGALEFDGSDDRIDLGTLDISGKEMSISFWFKADNFDERDARIISKATGTSNTDHYWMVSTFKNSSLRFRLKTNGTITTLNSPEDIISIGQWHHVTVTYDGSKMSIYRDGELVASRLKTGNIDKNNKIPVAIGNQPANAGSRPFDGLIDEVRIYNIGLAIDQIQAIIGNNTTLDQDAPVISGSPITRVEENNPYSFQPSASDPNGDNLVFSISGQPSWTTFNNSTGLLSGTPGTSDVATYSNILISVSDGTASSSLPAFSIVVNAYDPSNSAPTIKWPPSTTATEDSIYAYQPIVVDADGDKLTFNISNRPAWASFNTSTGYLSGTPDNGDVGTYSDIKISVSDGLASASTGAFSITVSNTNDTPVISGSPMTRLEENNPYNFQPSASDPDGDKLVFSISGRPSWATFNNSTGQLSGTPGASDTGTYSNILISVSDGTASSNLTAFSIIVDTIEPSNTGPTISGSPSTTAIEGSAYVFQPNVFDADGDKLAFGISNRPSWASFDSSNGRLSGTPAVGDAGTYSNILISVSDGLVPTKLPTFNIQVEVAQVQTGAGSFTLRWTEPVSRVDNTALFITEIASFSIHYGTSPGIYPNSIDVDNTAQTLTVNDLPEGTYYVVMTTIDTDGLESTYSEEITKDVQ